MNWLWGDLHNHCAVSYGMGTVPRALANAREHLDFCTITGHAFWPDMPMDLVHQDRIIGMHLGGFAKLQHYWPAVLEQLDAAHKPGEFVTFPSYEWHSMRYGDHNCYAPSAELPLLDAANPAELAENHISAGRSVMVLPHHIGYARGFRGLDWESFDADRSPLVEIFSNHGSGEADDAGYDYHHSMGPRTGDALVRAGLVAGHRFGFYASTDSHNGYPGHYGHGRVGVLSEQPTRDAIWEGLRQRRTIASTGARITGGLTLGGAGVGGVTARRDRLPLRVGLEGNAPFEQIRLIVGDETGWAARPLPAPVIRSGFEPGRYKVRIETGWGRGAERTSWEASAELVEAQLLGLERCFRYSGYDNREQTPTERVVEHNDRGATWVCCSQPNPAGMLGGTHFAAGGTQSVVLDIDAHINARLRVRANGRQLDLPLRDLADRSFATPIAGFGSPAIKVHRAIPEREFTFAHEEVLETASQDWGFVYLRAVQSDGQTAWLSPVWYES